MITAAYGISVDSEWDFHLSLMNTIPRLSNLEIVVATIQEMPVREFIEILRMWVSEQANEALSNYFPYGKKIADEIRRTKGKTNAITSGADTSITREQIFKLLQEENMSELERGQAPIYTQFVNPNLP